MVKESSEKQTIMEDAQMKALAYVKQMVEAASDHLALTQAQSTQSLSVAATAVVDAVLSSVCSDVNTRTSRSKLKSTLQL